MSEWRETTVGDVVTFQRGFDIRQIDQTPGSIPVISSSGITSYHNEFKAEGPGVLVGRKGTLGTVFYVENNYWPHSTSLWVKDFHGNYPRFIYYFLKTFDLKMHDVGSSNPTLNRNHVHLLRCTIPSHPEQCAIAEVLSSLDDKIDLLTRQNTTLEALAQTYFRQWFTEKAQKDWDIMKISDFADVTTGKGLKREFFADDGQYPVLGANGEIGRTNSYLYNEHLIITGRVGTHGKVFLINDKVWISDNVLIIKPKQPQYIYGLYFWLKNLDFNSLNVGSTQPLITQTDIKNQELLYSKGLFEKFANNVDNLFEKIERNNAQIITLQKLRDTLLPKLISGEVRITV